MRIGDVAGIDDEEIGASPPTSAMISPFVREGLLACIQGRTLLYVIRWTSDSSRTSTFQPVAM